MTPQEEKYINFYHGLELGPDWKPGTRSNENGILFLCEYYFLKYLARKLTYADITIFSQICQTLTTVGPDGMKIPGLFDRGAKESQWEDRSKIKTISHDNLSAISAFSYKFGLPYHNLIYKHGVKNFWRFDNIQPENPRWSRIMIPRDIIYWSRLGGGTIGKTISWFFMWYFYATCLVSCRSKTMLRPQLIDRIMKFLKTWNVKDLKATVELPDTSGKLLVFMRLFPLARKSWVAKKVWNMCKKRVEKNFDGGYHWIFNYYFKDPEQPIRVLSNEIIDF